MADIQQRLAEEHKHKLEIKSLEQQILELQQARFKLSKNQGGVDKTLQGQLNSLLKDNIQFLSKRKTLQEARMKNEDRFKNIVEQHHRQALRALMIEENARMEEAKNLFAIGELEVGMLKEQIDLKKYLRGLDHDRISLANKHLEVWHSYFASFGKWMNAFKEVGKTTLKQSILYSSWLAMFNQMIIQFGLFDKATSQFRMKWGLMRKDAVEFHRLTRETTAELAHLGVTFEKTLNSLEALGEEFGGIGRVGKDLVEYGAILNQQLGVSEAVSAGFLRNVAGISKSTAQSQKYMGYFASRLSAAAGIPLNIIMQDIAKMSGQALAMVSKIPEVLIKSATEARTLGMSLNKIADASRSILNFSESVASEMEASVLLGNAINLQKARELAYNKDLIGSTREILKIAKQIDFENLDVFQMEAFAAATGRTVEDLVHMLQTERQLRIARNDPNLAATVAVYDRLKKINGDRLKDVAKQREMEVRGMANQERMVTLQNKWNELMVRASEVFFPVIDGILSIGIGLMNIIHLLGPIFTVFNAIRGVVQTIALKYSPLMLSIYDKIFKVGGAIGGILSKFSIFAKIGSFLSPFFKFVPVVGWIVTGFQFIYNLIRRIGEEGLSFKSIWGAVYDTLLKPFVDAWDWLKSTFIGNSPSKIAMGILEGILAIDGMMFSAITSPFKKAWSWITNLWGKLGGDAATTASKKMASGIMKGVVVTHELSSKKAEAPKATIPTVAPKSPNIKEIATETGKISRKATEEKEISNRDVLTALNEMLIGIKSLNENLLAGKIGVYIDGQLLSTQLARQTAFEGGYGTHDVKVS